MLLAIVVVVYNIFIFLVIKSEECIWTFYSHIAEVSVSLMKKVSLFVYT